MNSEARHGHALKRIAGATILVGSLIVIGGVATSSPASAGTPDNCQELVPVANGSGVGIRVDCEDDFCQEYPEECEYETTTTEATTTTAAETTTTAAPTTVLAATTIVETTVPPDPPVQAAPAVQSRELAYTDSSSTLMTAALGLALISVGALLLGAQRRRLARI